MTVETPKLFTGRKFLLWVVAFFGVIIAVNVVFISLALKSNSGVVTESPYERGLAYDKTIARAEEQKKLGWTATLDVEGDRMRVTLKDKEGKGIDGKSVTVRMMRPVQQGHDFDVVLEGAGNGTYAGTFRLPLKGAWNAHISVVWADGTYDHLVPLDLE